MMIKSIWTKSLLAGIWFVLLIATALLVNWLLTGRLAPYNQNHESFTDNKKADEKSKTKKDDGFNALLSDASALMKTYNLSGEHIELFNNLSKGNLSPTQIDKLIQDGIITSALMDKFLVMLNGKDTEKKDYQKTR